MRGCTEEEELGGWGMGDWRVCRGETEGEGEEAGGVWGRDRGGEGRGRLGGGDAMGLVMEMSIVVFVL